MSLLWLLLVLHADEGLLKSGPMLANVEMMEATIWLETREPALVDVVFWPTGDEKARAYSVQVRTDRSGFLTAAITLVNLNPGTRYAYRVRINEVEQQRPYATEFTTQEYWQWRKDPKPFQVLFGSCLYINDQPFDRPGNAYGSDLAIIQAMVAKKPDLMLWLGDNHYYREPEFFSAARMQYRFSRHRSNDALQALWAACAHYAIWDDHDYGPNDSDRSYRDKYFSLGLFRAYWPNPTAGTPDTPGVFTKFRYHDVEFFLLDDRFHRAANKDPRPDKDYLGDKQLKWLMDGLLSSEASFKIVVNGNQVFNDRTRNESYAHYRDEHRRLREWLDSSGVDGILFLSGDRHFTELIKLEREGLYPLYEYTSSPLTSGVYKTLSDEIENPRRVPGTLVHTERNFGTLSFSGGFNDRTLVMRCFSRSGDLIWQHQVHQNELRVPVAKPTIDHSHSD